MNNAVGPVALICAGIYLGYLTLTGQATRFVNFLKGGAVAAPSTSTPTTNAQSATQVQANILAGAYGGNLSGAAANTSSSNWDPASAYSVPSMATQMLNAAQQSGVSGAADATGSYIPTGGP